MDVSVVRARLSAGVDRHASGCWLWHGCLFNTGYGAIGVEGKTRSAHRVSYEVFVGPIPDGLQVCHHCDVKRCVNPEHLYIGDAKQNAKDALERGQKPIGDRHWRRRNPDRQRGDDAPHRTLTEVQVREILASDKSQSELSRQYGVSVQQIHRIVRRLSWRHVE